MIINMTKNSEKSSDLLFFATHEKSQFLLLRANLDISNDCELNLSPMIFIGNRMVH